MTRKALAASTLLAALALLPSSAAACPVCARDQSPHVGLFVGILLSVPFALAAGVVLAVRRGEVDVEEDR